MQLRTILCCIISAIITSSACAQCTGGPLFVPQWLPLFEGLGVQTDRTMDARYATGFPPRASIFATVDWDPDGDGPLPTGVALGGHFASFVNATSTNVAAWAGGQSISLGLGLDDDVRSLCVYQGQLYAGGKFRASGSESVNRLARWDAGTESWLPVGVGVGGEVTGLAASSTHLYASGSFQFVGGVYAPALARFDGSVWSALIDSANGRYVTRVESMSVFTNGDLIVAGDFSSVSTTATPLVAIWNGSTWTDATPVPPVSLRSLHAFDPGYVLAQRVSNSQVMQRIGGSWSQLGSISPAPSTFNVVDGILYVRSGSSVLRWNGASWGTFAPASGTIDGFFSVGGLFGDFYAHGPIEFPANTAMGGIARWDAASSSWKRLGSGPNKPVRALHSFGQDLILGGEFTSIDGQMMPHVAKWRNGVFSPMGAGRPADILAFTTYNGQLVSAGKRPASPMVWNGSAWQNVTGLSDGLFDSTTRAMLVHNGFLHLFGRFPLVNNQFHPLAAFQQWAARWEPGNGLVALNATTINNQPGNQFGALSGVSYNGEVRIGRLSHSESAFCVYNNELIVAGNGLPGGVSRWTGSGFQPMGTGVSGGVAQSGLPLITAMTVFQGELYVAGDFTIAGGVPSNRIARWNGSFWRALEAYDIFVNGVNDTVHALAVHDNKLFVAGRFTTAGGRGSRYLAVWGCPILPPTCNSIDFNRDGLFPDTQDVDDFVSVFQGGPCSTGNCGDIDFNNDGLFPDTLDLESLLNVFAGGGCL